MELGSIFLLLAVIVLVGLYLYAPFMARARRVTDDSYEVSALLAERDRVINSLQELDFDNNLGKITDQKDVEELTVVDAETFTDKYDLRNTVITDEGIVRAMEIKAKAGVALSSADLKALDPADSTLGIQYRVRFIDKVKIRMGIK